MDTLHFLEPPDQYSSISITPDNDSEDTLRGSKQSELTAAATHSILIPGVDESIQQKEEYSYSQGKYIKDEADNFQDGTIVSIVTNSNST